MPDSHCVIRAFDANQLADGQTLNDAMVRSGLFSYPVPGENYSRLVLQKGDSVFGIAGLMPGASPDSGPGCAQTEIWIDPAVRNRGYGERLLEALLARARSNGFNRIQAQIEGYNVASIRLHQKLGFVRRSDYDKLYVLELRAQRAMNEQLPQP